MTDSIPNVWSAFISLAGLTLFVGFVAWQMRRDRKEFNLPRVLGISFVALLGSLPFAAAFWWFAPHDTDNHSPLLLAGVFVPIFILASWGIVYGIRRMKRGKNG